MTPIPIPWRLLAAGGAAAVAWHWMPLIGPHARFLAYEKAATANAVSIAEQKSALDSYDKALGKFGEAITSNSNTATTEASQMSSFWRGQCKTAFEAGYASGKGSSGGVSGSQPDGVRVDLRSLWAKGAIGSDPAAPAPLPSQPKGSGP